MRKRIVCFANSRKPGGHCVAGKEIQIGVGVGSWLRPVSARTTEEVSDAEERCSDGKLPELLDVLQVSLVRPSPDVRQPENWLLDPAVRWQRQPRIQWTDLSRFADAPQTLWTNTSQSGGGVANRVAACDAAGVDASLYLLHIPHLTIRVSSSTWEGETRRPVRGEFMYHNQLYRLSITDVPVETAFRQHPDGAHIVEDCFITVSLGKPFEDGFCYKLIAAVITRSRASGGDI